jgi:predicted nucleic acid-binding protein
VNHLLDTNAWVAYLRGKDAGLIQRLNQANPDSIYLCSIVVAELIHGAHKSGPAHCAANLSLIAQLRQLRARDLADDLARTRPPLASQSPAAIALPAKDFDKILNGLKKEAFDEGKLTYVENFAATRPLSCERAAALLKCFTFDEGRVKAVKVLSPKLIDRHNFNDVLNTFVFESSKAEARKAVGLK